MVLVVRDVLDRVELLQPGVLLRPGIGGSDDPSVHRRCADRVRHLTDARYPDAEQIVLVTNQIDTHAPASLNAAFPRDAGSLDQREIDSARSSP